MEEIQELDQRTIELITGGEVYVRPLSIVKECVENCLDAQSARIRIYIEDGGYSKIQCEDDGHGIVEALLPELCKAHRSTKDRVLRNTLGFRGEALTCLSYMARLRLTTKTAGVALASVADYEDGAMVALSAKAVPFEHGTVVEVSEIYKKHQVRRSNRTQAASERAAIAAFLVDLKIFYADVAISLNDQSGCILHPGKPANDRSFRSRVPVLCSSFPSLTPAALTEVTFTRVWGEVSGVVTIKQGKDALTDSKFIVFVNSRPVVWPNLKKLVLKVYESYMSVANSMNLISFWDIRLKLTDENVDRTKLSIQVMDEPLVLSDFEKELKGALDRGVESAVELSGVDQVAALRNFSAGPTADSSLLTEKLQTPKQAPRLNLAMLAQRSTGDSQMDSRHSEPLEFFLDTGRGALPPLVGEGERMPTVSIHSKVESSSFTGSSGIDSSSLERGLSTARVVDVQGLKEWDSRSSVNAGRVVEKRQTLLTQPILKAPALAGSASELYNEMRSALMEGEFNVLESFEFIGTVDLRRFVAGNELCIVTIDLSRALKQDLLPQLVQPIKLRPPLNLLEAKFLPIGHVDIPDAPLNCKRHGLVIKNFVLESLPKLPGFSEPNVGVWIELLYDRGLRSLDSETIMDMVLDHECRSGSYYSRFIAGAKIWAIWLKRRLACYSGSRLGDHSGSRPDDVVVSPPLRAILKHFERC